MVASAVWAEARLRETASGVYNGALYEQSNSLTFKTLKVRLLD